MSFYLKYRPQTVEELDSTGVRQEMGKILSSGKFSHAYLFTGPKGTGKTSSARILAKVLNCETNKKQVANYKKTDKDKKKKNEKLNEPCNKCDNCLAVINGTSLSVMEMDAASNRGIDDIRSLREKIGLMPAGGEITVYVVDEVHMLTTEAFNALLKTLEEPPEHVVFVLCTTEANKVPDTIKSRCTRILFQKANSEEVMRSLKKAVDGEGIKISDQAMASISTRVDGSFRDGMKILEQLAQMGEKIDLEQVDEMTGYSDDYNVKDLITCLMEGDVNKGMEILAEKDIRGVDFSVFGKRLVEVLRQQLIVEVSKSNPNRQRVFELTELTAKCSKAVGEIRWAVVPALPIELVVVEWCLRGEGSVKAKEASTIILKPKTTNVKPPIKTKKDDADERKTNKKKEAPNISDEQVKVKKDEPERKVEEAATEVVASGEALELELVKKAWPNLLRAVKPHNHSLEALLRATEPDGCVEQILTLRVYYNFHKEQLEQERHRSTLEKVFATELGSPVRLEFVLGNRAQGVKVPVKTSENVTGKLADEELAEAAEEIFS